MQGSNFVQKLTAAMILATLFILIAAVPLPAGAQLCGPIACGNGCVEAGEECDDGNLTNGDGCDSLCKTSLNMTPLPALFTYSQTPTCLGKADLDQDGIEDLIVGAGPFVYTYLHLPDGSFQPAGPVRMEETSLDMLSVTPGNFNDDSFPDIFSMENG
jgi:cysteine-rich repeat protein